MDDIEKTSHPELLSRKAVILWSFLLTVVFETITVVLRFGFQLTSTEQTASTVAVMTAGIRIHHSYIGVAMLFAAWWMIDRIKPEYRIWMQWILICGWAMFWSDIIHHFAVLWPIEGDPQFDLVYPEHSHS
jgi:hypothetical protein